MNHGRTSTDLARAATLPPAAALAGLRCGCGWPDGRPGRPAAAREGPQPLGLKALPAGFLALLVAMIGVYLVLIELGKRRFYRLSATGPALSRHRPPRERHVHHRAARFSTTRGPGG